MGRNQSCDIALLPENRGKNRYNNILPCEFCVEICNAVFLQPFLLFFRNKMGLKKYGIAGYGRAEALNVF